MLEFKTQANRHEVPRRKRKPAEKQRGPAVYLGTQYMALHFNLPLYFLSGQLLTFARGKQEHILL